MVLIVLVRVQNVDYASLAASIATSEVRHLLCDCKIAPNSTSALKLCGEAIVVGSRYAKVLQL